MQSEHRERQLGHYARAALGDRGSRHPDAPPADRLARSGRTAGRIGDPANLQPGRVSCSR